MSRRIFLAWAGQTRTHSPQATHASGMTAAWPFSIRIALGWQWRTHL